MGEGRGDICQPWPGLPECVLVVACPPLVIRASDAYRWRDERAQVEVPDPAWRGRWLAMREALVKGDLKRVAGYLANDLRVAVEERVPEVRSLRQLLRDRGALGAEMSGSGPAVFGLFDDWSRAKEAVKAARALGCTAYLCRPVRSWGRGGGATPLLAAEGLDGEAGWDRW